MGRVLPREDFICQARKLKAQGKVLVFTNGVFDLLHLGHARYLAEAKKLGDVLLVGVNGDSSARRLKGSSRPILPEDERAELLAALAAVDYVTIFDELTAEELVLAIQPQVYVKGGDYALQAGKPLPEAAAVSGYGGRVEILSFHSGHSTGDLIERILRAYAGAKAPS